MKVVSNTIVRNEENWVWYSLNSVLPYVDQMLVFDTASTDKTVEIIKSIKSKKIIFERKGETNPEKIVKLRQEQLEKSRGDWILQLDGDEIWPNRQIEKLINCVKSLPKEKIAIVNRTRNCVLDVYHYQSEKAGKYQFLDYKGHLTIRIIRNLKNLEIKGEYPLEAFFYQGKKINEQNHWLSFCDCWHLHTTNLKRSGQNTKVINRKILKQEIGQRIKKEELPEVFFQQKPDVVPSVLEKASVYDYLLALVLTPIKRIKRIINV